MDQIQADHELFLQAFESKRKNTLSGISSPSTATFTSLPPIGRARRPSPVAISSPTTSSPVTPRRYPPDDPATEGARRPRERRPRRYLAAVAAVAIAPNPIRRESTGAPAVARVASLSATLRALRRFQHARTPVIVCPLLTHSHAFPPRIGPGPRARDSRTPHVARSLLLPPPEERPRAIPYPLLRGKSTRRRKKRMKFFLRRFTNSSGNCSTRI